MTSDTITPDTILELAQAITAKENELLVNSLPEDLLLDTITQTLGLDNSFQAFEYRHKAIEAINQAAYQVARQGFQSSMIFAYPAKIDETIFHDINDILNFRTKHIPDDWECEIHDGANGFAVIEITLTTDFHPIESLEIQFDKVHAALEKLAHDGKTIKPTYATCWTSPTPEEIIHVDFIYNENGQACTASVLKDTWFAASLTPMSEEEAIMLFYRDIEIDLEYDAGSITFVDTYTAKSRDQ